MTGGRPADDPAVEPALRWALTTGIDAVAAELELDADLLRTKLRDLAFERGFHFVFYVLDAERSGDSVELDEGGS